MGPRPLHCFEEHNYYCSKEFHLKEFSAKEFQEVRSFRLYKSKLQLFGTALSYARLH